MDKLGVHLTFLYPSLSVHYFMSWNILVVSLFAEVQVAFTVLHQSTSFQGAFFPSFPRLHSRWQGLAHRIKTISYLFIMGKDTCICNWYDGRQHDSCFTGSSIEIANESLASMYGTYLYPKQKGNNKHSDKPCLYTAFSKFVPSAGSQPGLRLVQSGAAPPAPRQLHQFTPRKKWGMIFSVAQQNYKRGEKNPNDLSEGWGQAASQPPVCWRGIALSISARLGNRTCMCCAGWQ